MKHIFEVLLLLSIMLSCNNSSSQGNKDSFSVWAMNNSQKIETVDLVENHDDLKLLQQIIGEAEVVCLGESRHDIHEQFKLKHRFIKYLVDEMHFTSFALEASLPYSKQINDYILKGKGNIEEIMANMPGWFLWDTREMKDILSWLYTYNKGQDVENKVKFYGIDIVAPNNGLEQVFEYLQKVDKPYFETIKTRNFARHIIDDNQWQNTFQSYMQLHEDEKQSLIRNYNELYQHIVQKEISYIENSSRNEYEWIKKMAYSVKEANHMFTETDRLRMGLIRDNAMANISLWIKERNDKLIIWAHNVHIAKSEVIMNMFPENQIRGMGYVLSQELKDKLVSIGASFNKGEFVSENRSFDPANEHTIDGALTNLAMDNFLLNFSGTIEDEVVKKWLNSTNLMRGQEFEMTCVPGEAFDAVFFTNTISKVIYNPMTLERLR